MLCLLCQGIQRREEFGEVMCYHFLYFFCSFQVIRFDLRERVSVLNVRVEMVVMLADMSESSDAELGCIKGRICRDDFDCAFWSNQVF